jgi:hypothetical protein
LRKSPASSTSISGNSHRSENFAIRFSLNSGRIRKCPKPYD